MPRGSVGLSTLTATERHFDRHADGAPFQLTAAACLCSIQPEELFHGLSGPVLNFGFSRRVNNPQ